MNRKLFKDLILILGVTAGGIFFFTASGQSNQELLLSWQVQTYQPPDYTGKNLPTIGAPIIAAITLIDQGKIADISRTNVLWYQNDKLLTQGVGVTRISFNAEGAINAPLFLEADVEYRGGTLRKTIPIPVVAPKIVLDAPYPDGLMSLVSAFRAIPYFFNINRLSELEFEWTVNNQPAPRAAENPEIFQLNVSGENIARLPFSIRVVATNPGLLEVGRAEKQLLLK